MEGSLRAPFIVRWPGRVPGGRTSNQIVHGVDTFTTLARFAGAQTPGDPIIDGVDQSVFLFGKDDKAAREGFPGYVLHAVKWRHWKVHFVWQEYMFDPPQRLASMITWGWHPTFKIADDFQDSLKKEPPFPPGMPDPYVPPRQ